MKPNTDTQSKQEESPSLTEQYILPQTNRTRWDKDRNTALKGKLAENKLDGKQCLSKDIHLPSENMHLPQTNQTLWETDTETA